jgi:hypothetical protein
VDKKFQRNLKKKKNVVMKNPKDLLGERINFIYKNKINFMLLCDISNLKVVNIVDIICDNCNSTFKRTIKNLKTARRKWEGKDICKSCSCKLSIDKKPQCSKYYWESQDVKDRHSLSVKNSDNFINGILNREDNSGDKNPMFGKSHSVETIKKMSIARTGKIGENSTAWKGGKMSMTRLIKGFQNRNGWYKMVYERDGFKCVYCGSKKKIEAHHKIPIKNIVDEYKNDFDINDDLYRFLISLDIIIDPDLSNGVTLCRECHKKEHINFGSHNPIVIK